MLDADTLARISQAYTLVLVVLGVAKLVCMLGLMSKMFECGDKAWGWVTGTTAFARLIDHQIDRWVPHTGIPADIITVVGTVVVLVVGWRGHRRYDAKRQMIVYSILVAVEMLLYTAGIVAGFVWVTSLKPSDA